MYLICLLLLTSHMVPGISACNLAALQLVRDCFADHFELMPAAFTNCFVLIYSIIHEGSKTGNYINIHQLTCDTNVAKVPLVSSRKSKQQMILN